MLTNIPMQYRFPPLYGSQFHRPNLFLSSTNLLAPPQWVQHPRMFSNTSRYPLVYPSSSFPYMVPFSFPSISLQPHRRQILPCTSYSNTRYNHLKESTGNHQRRVANSYSSSVCSRFDSLADLRNPFDQKDKSFSDLRQSDTSLRTSKLNERPSSHNGIRLRKSISPRQKPLPKAHSWHFIANSLNKNLSAGYVKHSMERNLHHSGVRRPFLLRPNRPSIRRKLEQKSGVIRINTLDEMPIIQTNKSDDVNSQLRSSIRKRHLSRDSLIHPQKCVYSTLRRNSTNNLKRSFRNQHDVNRLLAKNSHDGSDMGSDHLSRSSSNESFQDMLRHDPLLVEAMEDYKKFRANSSRSTPVSHVHHVHPTSQESDHYHKRSVQRNLSLDSLCSGTNSHYSSPSICNNSQSSFTSMERSEIRHLIKTMKQNSRKIPLKSCATIPHAPPFLLSKEYNRHCLKKSSIANELDKEFSRIRAQQPNQELSYVPPSMICRRKTPYCPINQKTKSINKEITPSPSPPPTFADLLRTVQLKPINTKKVVKNIKEICVVHNSDLTNNPAIKNSFNIKTQNDSNQTSSEIYENPVDNHTTQSKSSASDETDSSHQENDENTLMDYLRIKNETGWKTERLSETRLSTEKPEYATPMRKDMAITKQQTEDISTDPEVTTLSQFQPSLRLKSEQQSRSFSFCNPIIDVQQRQQQIRKDKIRPVSMFNFLHCGLTNPLPVTFQPNRNQAKDNIYATEEQIDKCIITQTDDNDGTQDINSAILQNHLDNNHLITDYFYSDFHIKSSRSSSLLHDISKVFYRRKQHLINGGEKTQRKNHRCSVM